MNRGAFGLAATFAWLVASSATAAQPMTKQECAAANESAQDLRRAGRLREARTRLAQCTATSCPGPIREDCAQRLKDVEAALPTVIFEAKNGAGHDLSAVHVTMDGDPLLDKLEGTPIALDPGEHRFVFEAEGLQKGEDTVVLREGERDRRVRIVLQSSAQPGKERSAPAEESNTQSALGISLGAAGVAGLIVGTIFGFVAKSTYDNAVQTQCGGNPTECTAQGAQDGRTAHSQATVSTVAFVGGGALLAGGALLFLTAPKSGGDVSVAPAVGSGGAGLALHGRW